MFIIDYQSYKVRQKRRMLIDVNLRINPYIYLTFGFKR